MREYRDIGRWDRMQARKMETKRRMSDPDVADNMDVRKDLIRRMEAGEITFDEMQAELKAIKRQTAGEHTAEPWFTGPTPGYLAMNQVHHGKVPITIRSDAHTEEIATVWTCLLPHEANARRIVACVNACTGIETETLEKGVIKEMVADLDVLATARRADAAEALLDECSQRLRKCIVAAGSDEEYADIAVATYRNFLDKKPKP